MTESIKTVKNNPMTQKDIEIRNDKRSDESYKTQSQPGQNALSETKLYDEAIEIMEKPMNTWLKELI